MMSVGDLHQADLFVSLSISEVCLQLVCIVHKNKLLMNVLIFVRKYFFQLVAGKCTRMVWQILKYYTII